MGACPPRQPRRQDDGKLFRSNCGTPRMGSAFRRVRGVNRLTLIRELPSTEPHLGRADTWTWPGHALRFLGSRCRGARLVWAGAQPANRLPVLTMVCGDDVGTAWTYVTGINLPAQCSMGAADAGLVG